MKKFIITCLTLAFVATSLSAQDVNWSWMGSESRHFAHANIGYDFGITAGVGYDYFIPTKLPVLLSASYSFPMGKDLVDDFKFQMGGQMKLAEHKQFCLTFKAYGNVTRHQTALVRMLGIGSETALVLGYYRKTWHVATEFGLIKPLLVNLKHSEAFHESYPAVQDGWYMSSGGYFNYGFQVGKSISANNDLTFKMGMNNAYAKYKDPLLPYYARLGYVRRF